MRPAGARPKGRKRSAKGGSPRQDRRKIRQNPYPVKGKTSTQRISLLTRISPAPSIHGIVIPGAVREALYILDGLLEQQTSLRPVEIMADTAGYTDIIFGLRLRFGVKHLTLLAIRVGDTK